MTLFDEIQSDILANAPLDTVMRRAKVLAYRLNSQEFKSWVEHELNGYHNSGVPLPEYRLLRATITGTFTNGAWIQRNAPVPLIYLPEDIRDSITTMRMGQGIKELESLVQSAASRSANEESKIGEPWTAELLLIYNHEAASKMNGYHLVKAITQISKPGLEHILDSIRNRLLGFILELRDQYPEQAEADFKNAASIPRDKVTRIFNLTIMNSGNVQVNQGDNMSVFDQRNQQVAYQYNAAGDINFGSVTTHQQFVSELQKLREELARAASAKVIDEENQTDAEYHMTKALQQAQKPQPDKKTILQHLNEAKEAIATVTAAAGMVQALAQAATLAQQLFK